MSRPPSTHSSHTAPTSYRISERDLTEIQLHSVDSINDLHRMHHPEHSPRGMQLPLSFAHHSPSSNGNLRFQGVMDANQTGQPISSKWQKHLEQMWSGSSRIYAAAFGVITLLLLMLFVTVYFLVQQGGAIRMLTEAVREKQDISTEISQLIQELQALRHNLTALRDRP